MTANTQALFIIDASHSIEEEMLLNWVESEAGRLSFSNYDQIVVPIAGNPENIPVDSIAEQLGLPDDCQFIPVRVVWRTSLDKPHSRPRFRDLIRGNRRNPSKRSASAMLLRDPDAAQCISGRAASLGAMRLEHASRLGSDSEARSLADHIANQAALALHVAERRLRGSRYRVPQRVVPSLLANPEFKRELAEIARYENTTEAELLARAEGIFKELIATPTSF